MTRDVIEIMIMPIHIPFLSIRTHPVLLFSDREGAGAHLRGRRDLCAAMTQFSRRHRHGAGSAPRLSPPS